MEDWPLLYGPLTCCSRDNHQSIASGSSIDKDTALLYYTFTNLADYIMTYAVRPGLVVQVSGQQHYIQASWDSGIDRYWFPVDRLYPGRTAEIEVRASDIPWDEGTTIRVWPSVQACVWRTGGPDAVSSAENCRWFPDTTTYVLVLE